MSWGNRGNWPKSDKGHVFLGEAIDDVGRTLFPATWTGDESATVVRYPSGLEDASPSQIRAAIAHFPAAHRKEVRLTGAELSPLITDSDWSSAVGVLMSFHTVTERLGSELREGTVRAFVLDAGQFAPIESTAWLLAATSRFRSLKLSDADPASWLVDLNLPSTVCS